MFQNKVLSRRFRPKSDEVAGGYKKFIIHNSVLDIRHRDVQQNLKYGSS
jgi:hypothetical protein